MSETEHNHPPGTDHPEGVDGCTACAISVRTITETGPDWGHSHTVSAPLATLIRAARDAAPFVAKLSAEGNIFATRVLRRLEAALALAEGGKE